ncbi:MAG: T9SS type A sorting domain-containing protein [Ignavibacteria bacterium]
MKKLLVTIVLLTAINASAQWAQIGNYYSNGYAVYSLYSDSNYIYAGTDASGIFRTSINSINWVSFNNGLQFSYGIKDILKNGGRLFAASFYHGLYVYSNVNSSWSKVNVSNINFKPTSLYSKDNYIYMSFDEPACVFKSSDSGYNWSYSGVGAQYSSSLTSCGDYLFFGTSSGVYRSTLEAEYWTAMNNGMPSSVVESLIATGNTIFAGTWLGGVYRSTDFGMTWVQCGLADKTVHTFLVYNAIVLAGTDQGVFVTTNYGNSWINYNQGFDIPRVVLSLTKAGNYIIAGTNTAFVWRRALSELTSVYNSNIEIPSSYSLSQNYPNPFNPMTNVKFSIVKSGDVKIVVYDVMGREVQTLLNERLNAGTYEVKFDGSGLTSGVYFYRMVTGEFTKTKRMLLIK